MSKNKSLAVRVPKRNGEEIRRQLIEYALLRTDLKIKKDNGYLILPIQSEHVFLKDYDVVNDDFEVLDQSSDSYKDRLELPDELVYLLPSSFDCIGDIILVKIPKDLERYKENIGDALLTAHSHANTVVAVQPVTGELRVHPVEFIAGVKKTETIHTEYGINITVDVSDTYFSPRLAGERKRVASLVEDGEVIIDLFTGVAPFPLMIATYAHPKRIIAIDKNPVAISLAHKNIAKNKLLDKIDAFELDAQDAPDLIDKLDLKADRIIMNLPFDSFHFLPIAFSIMEKTATIHFYEILKEEMIQDRIDSITKLGEQYKILIIEANVRKIKTYAPHEFYIGIDITAKKLVDADVA